MPDWNEKTAARPTCNTPTRCNILLDRLWASTLVLGLMMTLGTTAEATTFTVTNTANSGAGSLRRAVADANANPGADVVAFAIPQGACSAAGVCSISLLTTISIDEAVTIDGTTQPRYGAAPANTCATATFPSYLRIEIDAPVGLHIFDVNSSGATTIRGLSLGVGYGVTLNSGSGHKIQCNHLGILGPGNAPFPAMGYGVLIAGSAYGAFIGTDGDGVDDIAERNVFGNCAFGIYINANDDTWVAGNYFGFLADGTSRQDNSISIFARQTSTRNFIGTNRDGLSDHLERNIIGNGSRGIWVDSGTYSDTRNLVVGNWIGFDAAGDPAQLNTGIQLGGDAASQVIQSNRIGNNITGLKVEDGITTSPSSMCNVIAGNTTGVLHAGTEHLPLGNNWWGTDDGPSGAGPGSGDSIDISGAGSVTFTPWLTSADTDCPLIFADDYEGGTIAAWSLSVP